MFRQSTHHKPVQRASRFGSTQRPAWRRTRVHARRTSLMLLLAAAALVIGLAPPAMAEVGDPLGKCGPNQNNTSAAPIDQRQAMACVTNFARCKYQIPPLYYTAWINPEFTGRPRRACFADGTPLLFAGSGSTFQPLDQTRLGKAAQSKAQDIINCQNFSHTACGRPADFWIRQNGYIPSPTCWGWAENIYWGSGSLGTAASAVTAWLGSAPHRANMMNPNYYDLGAGLARGTLNGIPNVQVWVQVFGYRAC